MNKARSSELIVQITRLAIIPMILLWSTLSFAAAWQWIDGQRVQNRMKEGTGLWLIDVRSAAAYEAVHIEGSVNIPAEALKFKKFPAQKTLILVDDALGQRDARKAAEALVKNGQERVSILEGGLALWKLEGLPLMESRATVRGVTADELKWALEHSALLRIYDLRDAKARKQGAVQKSEAVAGKTVAERVEKMKGLLATGKTQKKKDLAERMKKPEPVVLVFSASDDAEGYTRKIMQGVKADVRYVIGGYEATVSEKVRGQKTAGSCPTCPKKGK